MTDNLPQTQFEILICQTEDRRTRTDIQLRNETVWLSQNSLAGLLQKDIRTTKEHIKNFYAESKLEPRATIRKFKIVQTEGKCQVVRQMNYFNMDAF